MILNDIQTRQVATYLEKIKGLKPETKEELLDHICCEIEEKIALGTPFEVAWDVSRERWNEDEVQKIHSSTQNSQNMLKLIAFGLITAVVGLFSLQHATPDSSNKKINGYVLTTEYLENLSQAFRLDPPSVIPLASGYQLSSPYGQARHPLTKEKRFHKGIDFKAAEGTLVFAAGAGEVLEAGPKGKYGNCIIIVHDEIYQTLYAHLESIEVKAGDYLTAGQSIGTVGNTGVSTGPHLHYEVIKNGEKVNPANYLP